MDFAEDSFVFPAISRDGKTIVFRHLFDLYRFQPSGNELPTKIELTLQNDVDLPDEVLRRKHTIAEDVAFTEDGLEIAFIAGGDVWVMDTKLREPQRVTKTDGYEQDVLFAADGQSLLFTAIQDGQTDIWKATRKDTEKFWWQNKEFGLEKLTDDMLVESELRFTPDAKQLLFQQGRGDLVTMDLVSKQKRTLASGFSGVGFDVSPDSRWVAYASQDNDFNSEIWIASIPGDSPPVNVSRHPDNDQSPKFSPDGKLLAFTGRRYDEEVDIYYVYLSEADDEQTSRERRIEEAMEWMKKKRKADGGKDTAAKKPDGDKGKEEKNEEEKNDKTVDGKRGWYTVEFPSELTPKLLTNTTGSRAVWTEKAGGILFSQNGIPAKLDPNGKLESYAVSLSQESSRSGWLRAGFDKAWLTMRDTWYDERLANRNWDEVRRKYLAVASELRSVEALGDVVELMLGELNGSHLGFTPQFTPRTHSEGWRDETAHLGVRFVDSHKGPGLLIRDILPGSPADREKSKLQSGDTIFAIDGHPVDPSIDLTTILNGQMDRDIAVRISRKIDVEGKPIEPKEMEFVVRPISYVQARSLLYDLWLESNRVAVDKASKGKLGYLHIRAMDMGSFYEFERQLYNVGYGREGIVIDVRDNGGGSTTDLLLTALTQPKHAITVPRGGIQGYLHDRIVYASWSKPIIVLCNQNCYSNADIFSQAIKTVKCFLFKPEALADFLRRDSASASGLKSQITAMQNLQ